MTRVQPEDDDWTREQHLLYEAELVLELYLQGRSCEETSLVTGYPADTVRQLAHTAGRLRSPRHDFELACWRAASRTKLAKMVATDLLYAWLDDAEVEHLAERHGVPADLMWDAIAAELAKTSRADLRRRPDRRIPPKPLRCIATCAFACTWTCGLNEPEHDDSAPKLAGLERRAAKRRPAGWPPTGRLNKAVTVDPEGLVALSAP